MEYCYDCDRKFVKKVKDDKKECICAKWLCGEEIDNSRHYDSLRYLCHDCDHEQKRSNARRARAERELAPKKKKTKQPKEKK